ncbi:hypothetical protein GCM10028805_33080 [Spirosoma harenae]
MILILTAGMLVAITAKAQNSDTESEQKLKAKVQEMGLNFSVSDNGNFKFTFGLEKDRTQLVVIRKKLMSYLGTDYIQVYSPTMRYATKEQIPRQALLDMMTKNGMYKLGGFELVSDETTNAFYLSYKLPLTSTAVNLYSLMKDIAQDADKTEQMYTSADDY